MDLRARSTTSSTAPAPGGNASDRPVHGTGPGNRRGARARLGGAAPAPTECGSPFDACSGRVPCRGWLAPQQGTRRQGSAAGTRASRNAPRPPCLPALVALAAVALIVLLLTAFSPGGARSDQAKSAPSLAQRLLPSGASAAARDRGPGHAPDQAADQPGRVTAIGYHASGPTPLPARAGRLAGERRRLRPPLAANRRRRRSGVATTSSRAASAHGRAGLDVGAPVGTDVYAPVDGTLIAISDQIVDGKPYGKRLEIQPAGNRDS